MKIIKNLWKDYAFTISISIGFLVFQFILNLFGGYGYFRDEFYYISCSNNLDWGYVDHPPFSIFLLWMNRIILGDSIFSIRLLPALATSGLIILSGFLVKEIGGNRFAQILTSLSIFFAPVYLAMSSFFSMNVFEPLFWTALILLLLMIIRTRNQRFWIIFWLIASIGIYNKYCIVFFIFALLLSLIISSNRKVLFNKWFVFGVIISFLVLIPNILWQYFNHFPTLEFLRNAQNLKNLSFTPLDFLSSQILFQNPVIFPIWFTGLIVLIFNKNFRRFNYLGIAFIILFFLLVFQNGKPYYLSPIFPAILSAGAVFLESITKYKNFKFLIRFYTVLIILGGILFLPMSSPILPIPAFLKYSKILGINIPKMERHKDTPLPQVFADRFGWEEMTQKVSQVYNTLTTAEKSKTIIYARNYGEAGAIQFFGKKYNLPDIVSGHNNFWLWGIKNHNADILIIVGGDELDHQEFFKSVQLKAIHSNKYAMPFETDLPIYICKYPKQPIDSIWKYVKTYI